MFIGLICWIAIGLVAGVIVSKLVNEGGDDPKLGISLAAAGAVIAGFIFAALSAEGLNVFDARSLMFAFIGAAVALVAWHSIRRYVSRA